MKRRFVVITGMVELMHFARIVAEGGYTVTCERGAKRVSGYDWEGIVNLDPSYGMIVEYLEAAAALDEFLIPFEKDYIEIENP